MKMNASKSSKTVLTHFAENTSAHGIKKLIERNGVLLKVIWLLLLLGATGMFVHQAYHLVRQFQGHPMTTKTKLHNRNLTFPSVTICNLNPVLNSKVQNHPMYNTVRKMANWMQVPLSLFNDTDNSYMQTGYNYSFPKVNFSTNDPMLESYVDFKMYLQGLSYSELVPFSQSFNSFVVSCYYGRDKCDYRNFTSTVDHDYGICYTFPKKDQNATGLRVYDAGSLFGLKLILNVDQREYVPFFTPSAGARLQVHEFGSRPHLKELGYSVSTGFKTEIGFSPVIYKRRPAPYGTCDNSGRFQNVLECERLCVEQVIETTCNCTRRRNHTAFRLCLPRDIVCILKVLQAKQSGFVPCNNCHPTCRVYDFVYSFSMTTWPANHYDLALWFKIREKYPNFSEINMPAETRENFLSVHVYYSQLLMRIIEEKPSYVLENFISDIGGQLGLWLGISVLTLCEVLELIPLLSYAIGRTNLHKDSSGNNNPKS